MDENNYIEQANKEVCRIIEVAYLQAEEKRWVADMEGNTREMELQGEIASKLEAINKLVAPPSYFFTGFNKLPEMTGPQYRIKLLEKALVDDPFNYFLLQKIAELKAEEQAAR